MKTRFRIRTQRGRELAPDTLEAFTRLVRKGEVSPEDLVYDSLTGEWAPALAHPVYRLVTDPWVEVGEEETDADALPLDLVEPAVEPSPDQAARAFIEKMEMERQSDPERPVGLEGIELVGTGPDPQPQPEATNGAHAAAASPDLVREAPSIPDEGPSLAVTEPPVVTEPAVSEGQVPEPPREEGPGPVGGLEDSRPVHRAGGDRASGGAGGWRGPVVSGSVRGTIAWLVVFAALLAAALVRSRSMGPQAPTALGASPVAVTEPTEPGRALADGEVDVRAGAERVYAAKVRTLGRPATTREIPESWLDGAYLAEPSRFPEVREAWEAYLTLVWTMRANDARLYREAFLDALAEADVDGPTRTLRLSAAAVRFDAARPAREAEYAVVEELAVAALSLHDLLVHLEGSVSYEPARGPRLSADPIIEAVGRDDQTQTLLDGALDRVVVAMRSEGTGPGTRREVPRWVLGRLGGIAR